MDMVIGKHCKWTDVIGQVFRVLEFDRSGTIIRPGNKLKTKGFLKPYGYLRVESPVLNTPVRMPIVHRDDFLLAASVFDDPKCVDAVKEDELLVTYIPKKKLPGGSVGIQHGIHYAIVPRGTMERYYGFDETSERMVYPEPERIFGVLQWDGMLRVHMNPEPDV
jgi:hypothetical protein